ncbi:polysaccharide deacetylase family protein [Dechloromonas hortensis]|uniref:polysaccharide deacetylase family protein n=1 Tax=Dechloromonas hortensis TaxID=337779 RepID=UPI001291C072|nr:polysaccharide deacetylase family protein [Dechloromonas hortensis]
MSLGQPLPVLMYHHVSPKPGLVTCSPENFRAQMQWLAKNGWRTLSTAGFAEALASGRVPQKSVLVTFDDGYLDNWVYAHPVLQEFGQRATIFLITGWIGDGTPRPYSGQPGTPDVPTHKQAMAAAADGKLDAAFLRWSEVEAMRAAGTFDFHSHTHTHTRWDRQIAAQAERDAALAEDLAVSRETLAARLGEASPHLCWPQGYFDANYQRVARAAGFTHLYTTEHGVVRADVDLSRIPRLVAKDKPAAWFGRRMGIYGRPLLSALYLGLKSGKKGH